MKLQKLFSTPEHWTRGTDARTKGKVSIVAYRKDAFCFCLAGAIKRYYSGDHFKVFERVKAYILSTGFNYKENFLSVESFINVWNDRRDTTIADIQKLVKELDL